MTNIVITSILLGVGLAMDAFAASLANGISESKMHIRKVTLIAFMFALFQAMMPFIGYLVGSAILTKIEWIIPWVALGLLGYLGCKMIIDGLKKKEEDCEEARKLTFSLLIVQSVATSIDALSVGFTISDYKMKEAIVSVCLIAVVTFIICYIGVILGKNIVNKLGSNSCDKSKKLENRASIFGGIILLAIGIEIFITGMFF